MCAFKLHSDEYTDSSVLLRCSKKNPDLDLVTKLVLLRQLHLDQPDVLQVESPAE